MRNYRLYCLDHAGKISLAYDISASDDEEAVAEARKLRHKALKCEIWERNRLVASFDLHNIAN